MTSSPYRVIACDGGGIRGLITALLLQDLEGSFQVIEKADLFAGTSTGGIISIGLAAGLPIAKVVDLYQNQAGQIFIPYQPAAATTSDLVAKALGGLDLSLLPSDLLHVKYVSSGLHALLQGLVGSKTLADLESVVVTTFQLDDPAAGSWLPISLDNLPQGGGGAGASAASTLAVDAAMATGAAPIYFPPHLVPGRGYCIDGGTFANNPSTFAIARAVDAGVLAARGQSLADVRVLSLGTGFSANSIPSFVVDVVQPLNFGIVEWLLPVSFLSVPALPLLNVLFDGSSGVDTFQAQQLLGNRYKRGNVKLTKAVALDDIKAIPELITMTQDYMKTQEWQGVRDWVQANFA